MYITFLPASTWLYTSFDPSIEKKVENVALVFDIAPEIMFLTIDVRPGCCALHPSNCVSSDFCSWVYAVKFVDTLVTIPVIKSFMSTYLVVFPTSQCCHTTLVPEISGLDWLCDDAYTLLTVPFDRFFV